LKLNRYFIDLFGCVKNQVDAENMMAFLNKAGWESAPAEKADLIIINSCGFIKSAKQESIDAVLGWRKLHPEKKILLAGCLAQRYAKELAESLTEADGFIGVGDPAGGAAGGGAAEIVKIASQLVSGKNAKKSAKPASGFLPPGERPLLSLPGSAYVKISEGCSNRCSYCAIPLIRGNLVSRSIKDITDECSALLDRGIKELCIVGQDIGSYGADCNEVSRANCNEVSRADVSQAAVNLPELLKSISRLKENFWVRLLYIHPDHFPLPILDIMQKDPRFLPYFDIPFQHASSKILSAMNRGKSKKQNTRGALYSGVSSAAETYLELLKTIRSKLPNSVIRSTFLLGFPGETEEDFAALLDFQEKASLDWLGCFTYSREEDTASYSMKGRVPAKIAEARKKIIEERQVQITEKNLERFIGQELDVLLEEKIITGDSAADSGQNEGFILGRLYNQAPDIDGATVIPDRTGKIPPLGRLVPCRITARNGFDLEAQI